MQLALSSWGFCSSTNEYHITATAGLTVAAVGYTHAQRVLGVAIQPSHLPHWCCGLYNNTYSLFVHVADELAAVGIEAFGGPHDNDKSCSFSQEMTHDTQV